MLDVPHGEQVLHEQRSGSLVRLVVRIPVELVMVNIES